MKNVQKAESLDLKEILKLHPIEREKELRKLLVEKNKTFFDIINKEIEKAELEQEDSEKLEDISRKKETNLANLDKLVEKFSDEELSKEAEKNLKGEIVYGVKENPGTYGVYLPINTSNQDYLTHTHEHNKQFDTLPEQNKKSTFGEELNNEGSFKKIDELYRSKNKKLAHEH